jgi:hypothetical protein
MSIVTPVDKTLADAFLVKFQSKEHLKNWIDTFIGWNLPDSFIDPESNSSPIEWMYSAYSMYRDNTCNTSPSIITISTRGGYKTLTQSIFSVIMMLHFNASYCHGAAIIPQAQVAQEYVSKFLVQLQPFMEYHNIYVLTDNSKDIKLGPKGAKIAQSQMKILVLNMAGSNAAHSNLLCLDEVDLLRSAEQRKAFGEISKVPAEFDGQFPLTIKTSTLKFRSGLFSQQLDLAKEKGWQVHKWNLLDITEKCQPERHGERTNQSVYARYELPLKTIKEDEYNDLVAKEKEGYKRLDNVRKGCMGCSLLPVCKGRLAERAETDKGGFWKSIEFTKSELETTEPDLATAQLLCRRAAASGMVYPRFEDRADGEGNTYSLEQAFEKFTGDKAPKGITYPFLLKTLLDNGTKFYASGDWGHTGAQAFVVAAQMGMGEFWLLDSYSIPNLEWEQVLDLGKRIRDQYRRPLKWFMDTNQPMFIKAFNKNQMKCAKFTKDIFGGISSIRGQILDGANRRKLKVIKHDRTKIIVKMFQEHAFKLDSLGNPTQEPDDSPVSHIGDSVRYMGQNLFAPKGGGLRQNIDTNQYMSDAPVEDTYENWLEQKIAAAKSEDENPNGDTSGLSESGSVFWDFGGTDDVEPTEDESAFKFKTEEELMAEYKANEPKESKT